jgi:hypothetical protein
MKKWSTPKTKKKKSKEKKRNIRLPLIGKQILEKLKKTFSANCMVKATTVWMTAGCLRSRPKTRLRVLLILLEPSLTIILINFLTKVSKKRKVLEQYAVAAYHGLAMLAKAKKQITDKSSSSDKSVKSIEIIEHCVKKKPKRKACNKDEVTEPMKKLSLGKAPEDISSNKNEFAN